MTNKARRHQREVAQLMAEDARARRGKRGRWLSHVEATAERRFRQFRPYHVQRDGKTRFGTYDMRHCSQSVRESEAIEGYFHARRMRAAGYAFSRGMSAGPAGAWVPVPAIAVAGP